MNITNGSVNLPRPVGSPFFDLEYVLAVATKININKSIDRNIEKTIFVIDKSSGFLFVTFPATS